MLYRRVRDLREDHDKTQKEIADLLHIDPCRPNLQYPFAMRDKRLP